MEQEVGREEGQEQEESFISKREIDGVVVLDIAGEIIGDRRLEFAHEIWDCIERGQMKIILNVEEVPMMDSVGLGMISMAHSIIQGGEEKGIVLLNPGRSIRYLLAIVHLNQLFEQYEDEDEAIASFRK